MCGGQRRVLFAYDAAILCEMIERGLKQTKVKIQQLCAGLPDCIAVVI